MREPIPMDASEAGRLTESNLKSDAEAIERYLEAVYSKVRRAAEAGQRSITDPWIGLRMPYPNLEIREAIWVRLTGQGYRVNQHPDPDPLNPVSRARVEISW